MSDKLEYTEAFLPLHVSQKLVKKINKDLEDEKRFKKIFEEISLKINIAREERHREICELKAILTKVINETELVLQQSSQLIEESWQDIPPSEQNVMPLQEEILQLQEENVQLKQENVQLKQENISLKNQIQNLWKLFTTFVEKKISATSEKWSSFFAMNKEVSDASLVDQKNSKTNGLQP